jgi:hypothetical protein
MKRIRLTFILDGIEAVLELGPFSPYWAELWLDVIRQQHGVAGLTFGSFRARIVDAVL